MSELLLSRTLDPDDYRHMADALRLSTDHYAPTSRGTHPQQQWEYVIALHAIARWREAHPQVNLSVGPIYDIGGTGRPFAEMLRAQPGCEVTLVVDPVGATPLVRSGMPLADLVTCLSWFALVPEPEELLYACSCLLAPGGLLVLTLPFWNHCGPDTAVNAHMRRRIYCPKSYAQLRTQAQALQLTPFGGVDPTWHGPQMHDYSLASLVLEKRR